MGGAALEHQLGDTIAALATAPGKGAIAVIRISGPGSRQALTALSVRPGAARRACLRTLRDSHGGVLDRGMVIWFPAPHSYTGEDSAELHLHGGVFVVEAVLAALLAGGVRLAEPGEFSRRAFGNGKLDLAQAEAIADLVDAENGAQARQALDQLGGALGARYAAWRQVLIQVLARLEVLVDFPDDHIGDAVAGVAAALADLAADLEMAIRDGPRGERVREGYRVAVVGPPNAGKSSLFNKLVGREAAIVSDLPGTTRDIIEAVVNMAGYRVILADTAGLRVTDSGIEAEGIRRARAWATDAERRIWVLDGSTDNELWRAGVALWRGGDLCVINKTDMPQTACVRDAAVEAGRRGLSLMSVSVRRNGADAVREWLSREVVQSMAGSDFPAITRRRHGLALASATAAVRRALGSLAAPELASEDLRLAARALGSVTGAIGPEDVLEEVFANFCIGK